MNLTLLLRILVQPSFYLYFTTNEDCFYFYSSNTSAYLFGRNDTVYIKLVDRDVVKEYNKKINGNVFSSGCPSTKVNGQSITEKVNMSFETLAFLQEPIIPEQEPTYECKSFNKWYLLLALFIGFVFGFPIPVDSLFETIKAKRIGNRSTMNSYFICRLLDDFNVLKVSKTHLEKSYRRLRGRALLLKTFKYNLPDVVDEEFYFRQ